MYFHFFYHARFLSDARLNFEENLYLHYIIDSTYITLEVTVDDFLLYFGSRTSSKGPAIINKQ